MPDPIETTTEPKPAPKETPEIDHLDRIRIENLAYARYQERAEAGLPGTPEEDWILAEKELNPGYNG